MPPVPPPANVLVTGNVGGGKSYWASRWLARWARRGPLVIVDRSPQHAALVGHVLTLDRDALTRRWAWDRLLTAHPRLLVQVTADPALAWPALEALGDALYRVGGRRIVLEEAQRWTPANQRGARALALLATDGRRRGLDWLVIAPEVIGRMGGIAAEWLRESRLRIAFPVTDPLQQGHLGALVPAWRGEIETLRPLTLDPAGGVIPGEHLVADARTGAAARVDGASGAVQSLVVGAPSEVS